MNITRNNYERWFIDLIDGNLSTQEVDEVLDFLRDNPDLKEELNQLEKIVLHPDENLRFDKTALKKNDFEQPGVFEDFAVRSVENNLRTNEKQFFENYLKKNKQAAKDYHLFEATVSKPDSLVTYPNTSKLKRTRSLNIVWYLSAAAVVLLAALFWFTLPSEELVLPQKQKMAAFEVQLEEPRLQMPEFKREWAKVEISVQSINQALAQKKSNEDIEPEPLELMASLEYQIPESKVELEGMAPITNNEIQKTKQVNPYPTFPELLAQRVGEIDTRKPVNRFAQLALNRLSDATNEKLSFKTGEEGGVKKIEYNSRLLAFTVPVGNE